jgi:hypothetical protein
MYEKWEEVTPIANVLWTLLAIIQLLFFVYGFSIFYKKREH